MTPHVKEQERRGDKRKEWKGRYSSVSIAIEMVEGRKG
jgi:hypothetical protein